MIPRDPHCDNDNCDYDDRGRWLHVPGCQVHESIGRRDDIAWATALEDGVGRSQLLGGIPAQQGWGAR
jgi:hypothetical protein